MGKAGGKQGGGFPRSDELGDLLTSNLMAMSLQRNPGMLGAFGGGTALGKSYRNMFGNEPSSQQSTLSTPFANQARAGLGAYKPTYAKLPGAGGGMVKGAGAMTPVAGTKPLTFTKGAPSPQAPQPGLSYTSGASAPTNPSYQFQGTQLPSIQALKIPEQKFQIASQLGQEQIGQANKMATQDLMRQYGARGLGRSGLALQGAADQYARNAGQQASQLGRQLSADRMGLEFGEAQTARGLEAQRAQSQADLNQRIQEAQQGANLANRAQLFNEQMGLSGLGLQEQGQQLGAQNALLAPLSGLGQSLLAAGQSQGKK